MQRSPKSGSALLAATLLAALLATAGATFAAHINAVRLAASDHQKLLRARLDAESLIEAALVQIDRGEGGALRGEVMNLTTTANPGVVRAQDTRGLLDLNAAQPVQIAQVFTMLGASAEQAAALADRIADWRDEDSFTRPSGAEMNAYRAQGLDAPANAPFRTEEQLGAVLGVTADMVACIEPYITVFSRSAQIDPQTAPQTLIDALALPAPTAKLAAEPPIGRVVIVSAQSPLSENAAFRITRWVRLTGDQREPIMVHRSRVDYSALDTIDRSACARAFPQERRS